MSLRDSGLRIAAALAISLTLPTALPAQESVILPVIQDDWRTIVTLDRDDLIAPSLWQAADGSWQLRATVGDPASPTHLAWESPYLEATIWTPVSTMGPMAPAIQRPRVTRLGETFALVASDGTAIHMATSTDGRTFKPLASPAFDEGPFANAGDPSIVRLDDIWYMYHTVVAGNRSALQCRISRDLAIWSPPTIISYGGPPDTGPDWITNPIVVEVLPGEFVCLTSGPEETRAFYSNDPLHFGIDNAGGLVAELPIVAPDIARTDDGTFIVAPTPDRDGIRIARLQWARRTVTGEPVFDFDTEEGRQQWTMVSGDLDAVFFAETHVPFYGITEHYIGTCEQFEGGFDDDRTAVIESAPFMLDERYYTLLVGGGRNFETLNVAIVDADSGEELARYTGRDSNSVLPVTFTTGKHHGKRAIVRVVDAALGPWGHVNFGGIYRPGPLEIIE